MGPQRSPRCCPCVSVGTSAAPPLLPGEGRTGHRSLPRAGGQHHEPQQGRRKRHAGSRSTDLESCSSPHCTHGPTVPCRGMSPAPGDSRAAACSRLLGARQHRKTRLRLCAPAPGITRLCPRRAAGWTAKATAREEPREAIAQAGCPESPRVLGEEQRCPPRSPGAVRGRGYWFLPCSDCSPLS